ncbi:hypothetical protein IFM89_037119 [Coptis chinensis]|uniref:Uncharacterized protein n=1 Tax=Coptis chinensis TaxID=261450 RepID=A0A835LG96_9MAGN|nr:hypothetical protein IFM89_037119 [Coptis chinensis]
MNVAERRGGRKSLKERLGIAGIGCCAGAGWSCRATSDISVREEDEEEERHLQGEEPTNLADIPEEVNAISQVFTTEATEVPTGMNLGTALAAEREYRETHEGESDRLLEPIGGAVSKRLRVSLMRLLEEGDGVGDEGREKKEGRGKEDGGGEVMVLVAFVWEEEKVLLSSHVGIHFAGCVQGSCG